MEKDRSGKTRNLQYVTVYFSSRGEAEESVRQNTKRRSLDSVRLRQGYGATYARDDNLKMISRQ